MDDAGADAVDRVLRPVQNTTDCADGSFNLNKVEFRSPQNKLRQDIGGKPMRAHSIAEEESTGGSILKKRKFYEAMGGIRSDDEEDEDCDEQDGDKFWCGLRTISERVLQVLLEKRTTTYKQVSDMITNDEA